MNRTIPSPKGFSAVPAALLILGVFWRLAPALHPEFANLAPFVAIGFCAAVYSTHWRYWLLPFVCTVFVDWSLSFGVGTNLAWPVWVAHITSFAVALVIGRSVRRPSGPLAALSGLLGSEVIFYLLTNTTAWAADPFYPATLQGWLTALTYGHPEYPPTVCFFAHTLIGDWIFTAVFLVATFEPVRRGAWSNDLLSR